MDIFCVTSSSTGNLSGWESRGGFQTRLLPRKNGVRVGYAVRTSRNLDGTHSVPYGLAFIVPGANEIA